jgi:lipooligosaccharide transport system permease protein
MPLALMQAGMYAGRAHALVERSALVNLRARLALISGFFEPVLYLLAIGVGFGTLTGHIAGPAGQQQSYLDFVAPALLATSAMNGAVYDSTFNLFPKLRYTRLYDAVLATPLGPVDVALGEIAWAVMRGGLYSLGFFAILLGRGVPTSPWALLIVPAALVIAFAFAALGMAATTFMRSWQDFDLVQLALLSMFLFSTTFFPLTVYPAAIQEVVKCFPLYHGIEIMRALSAGTVSGAVAGHLAYFAVMAVAGVLIATRRLHVLLLR